MNEVELQEWDRQCQLAAEQHRRAIKAAEEHEQQVMHEYKWFRTLVVIALIASNFMFVTGLNTWVIGTEYEPVFTFGAYCTAHLSRGLWGATLSRSFAPLSCVQVLPPWRSFLLVPGCSALSCSSCGARAAALPACQPKHSSGAAPRPPRPRPNPSVRRWCCSVACQEQGPAQEAAQEHRRR